MTASLDNDREYRELRKEVTDKAFTSNIYDAVTTVLTLAAFGLGYGALVNGGAPLLLAGAAVSGIMAIGVGITNFRRSHDLALDYDELDSLRRARHLEQVVGKGVSAEKALAVDGQLGRDDGRSWGDYVTSRNAPMSEERLM